MNGEIIKELQLLTLLILPVTLGLFFRPLIFAFDGYATINGICTGDWSVLAMQPVTNFLFSFFPCSFLFFKIFSFLSLIITLYIIYKIMLNYYSPKISLYSLFFLLALSPIMLFQFAKFENDLWAYPFIALGIYFLLNKNYFKSFFSVALSLLFWVWPYHFTHFGTNLALELRPFAGLSSLFLFAFVIPFIFLIKNRRIVVFGVLALAMFLWNSKFFIFLVPFVALGIGLTLQKVYENKTHIKTIWVLCFFLLFAMNYSLFMQQPQQNQFDLLSQGIELAEKENLPIYNDWSYGHWIEYLGKRTEYKSGGHNLDYNLLEKPFVGLTDSNLLHLGCDFVSSARTLKVWICR